MEHQETFEEKKHRLKCYSPQFLAKFGFVRLVPNNPEQFICPFCGNGSGENGTGVDFNYTDEHGEYVYHCFRGGCPKENYDNVDIVKNALNLPFQKAIKNAIARIDGAAESGVIQPNINFVDGETPAKKEYVPKDYSSFYDNCEACLPNLLENGKYQYRGLTLKTLQYFRVGFSSSWGNPPTPRIIIPYNKFHYIARYYGDDKLLLEPKYKSISKKQHSIGDKPIFNLGSILSQRAKEKKLISDIQKWKEDHEDAPHVVMNCETPLPVGRPIFVVEGEIDAMTGYQIMDGKYHFIALGGCNISKYQEELLRANEKFPSSVFVVLLDNDKAGNAKKYIVAQKLIELGHYAIIGNLARAKDYINRLEYTPLKGDRQKHSKDLNEALLNGSRHEAREILFYLAGIAEMLSQSFGLDSEPLVKNYADLNLPLAGITDEKVKHVAKILHDIAVESIPEDEHYKDWSAENKAKYLESADRIFFSLFEVPAENAHPTYDDMPLYHILDRNFMDNGDIIESIVPKKIYTVPLQYVPYFLKSNFDDDGKFYITDNVEFNFDKGLEEYYLTVKKEVEKLSNPNNEETQSQTEKEAEKKSEDNAIDLSNSKDFTSVSVDDDNPAENKAARWTQGVIIDCPINLKVPPIYGFLPTGLRKIDTNDVFSRTPVVPTKTLVDVDGGIYSTELTFLDRKIGRWKKIIVEDRIIADPNELVKLASNGLESTKKQAKDLSNYLLDIREFNLQEIPREDMYSIPGWVDDNCDDFIYPEVEVGGRVLKSEGDFLKKKFTTHGSYDQWRDKISIMSRESTPLAVFDLIFGAALMAPLLRLTKVRNAQYLLWCQTGSGKSALVKAVMSIYGRPEGLKNTFNGTFNSLNDLPKMYNDFPHWVDEFQSATRVLREGITEFIYMFELGKIRMRLRKTSALRYVDEYKGVRIMTGEQPILPTSADAGAANRLLSISTRNLFPAEWNLSAMHNFFDENFGFFGRDWIDYISKKDVQAKIIETFQKNRDLFRDLAKVENWTNNWADNFALVLTARQFALPLIDNYFTPEIVKERFMDSIWVIANDIPRTETFTNSERALSMLEDYINAHPRNFRVEYTYRNENGMMCKKFSDSDSGNAFSEQGYQFADGSFGITQAEIKKILEEELGFHSYESILRNWRDEEKILASDTGKHKYTVTKAMSEPYLKNRRLVVFPSGILDVEIPRSRFSGKNYRNSDNDDE